MSGRDQRSFKGRVEPYTVKGILAAWAGATMELAKALNRIAAEYERRGRDTSGDGR